MKLIFGPCIKLQRYIYSKGFLQTFDMIKILFLDVKPADLTGFHVQVVNGNSALLRWQKPVNSAMVSRIEIRYGPSKNGPSGKTMKTVSLLFVSLCL